MKPHLLLPLILLPGISSCKKKEQPATSAATTTTQPAQTQTPLPPDLTPISLRYYITDADMRKRTGCPTAAENENPFSESYIDCHYPSQQLAIAGLPLPEGAIIARPAHHFVLKAPQSYHDQVAALLGVKGTPPPPPPETEE